MGRQTVLPTPFKNVAMVRRYIIIYIKVKNRITIYFQYALLPFQIFAGWGMMNGFGLDIEIDLEVSEPFLM